MKPGGEFKGEGEGEGEGDNLLWGLLGVLTARTALPSERLSVTMSPSVPVAAVRRRLPLSWSAAINEKQGKSNHA